MTVPHEPSAELRAAAAMLRSYFLALTAEGFTEAQALAVIGHTLRGATGGAA